MTDNNQAAPLVAPGTGQVVTATKCGASKAPLQAIWTPEDAAATWQAFVAELAHAERGVRDVA